MAAVAVPIAYPTVVAAPAAMMATMAPALLKPDGFQTAETDCCAQPGGCNRCCYVGCCMPCAFGDVAASLPPGSACCAGNKCGACCLYTTIGGAIYATGALFAGVGAYFAMPVVGLLTSALHYNVRGAFKRHHGIADNGCCPDLAFLIFCDACVLCQELRESDLRTPRLAVMPPTMVLAPQMAVMNPMMAQQQTIGYEAPKAV